MPFGYFVCFPVACGWGWRRRLEMERRRRNWNKIEQRVNKMCNDETRCTLFRILPTPAHPDWKRGSRDSGERRGGEGVALLEERKKGFFFFSFVDGRTDAPRKGKREESSRVCKRGGAFYSEEEE